MARVNKFHYSTDSVGIWLKRTIEHHKTCTERTARKKAKSSQRYFREYTTDLEYFNGGNDAILQFIPGGRTHLSRIYCANSFVNELSSPFANIDVKNTGRYVLIPPRNQSIQFIKTNREREIGKGYSRENDTEYKLLTKLASTIRQRQVGQINMYTFYEPCLSCDYVIIQFVKLYPNIKVNVYFEEEYRPKNTGVI